MIHSSPASSPTISRRRLLGLSGLALTDMLTRQAWAALRAESPPPPGAMHPTPRPRQAHDLHSARPGGLSQIDSYDYKPRLQKEHGREPARYHQVSQVHLRQTGAASSAHPSHGSSGVKAAGGPATSFPRSTVDGSTSSASPLPPPRKRGPHHRDVDAQHRGPPRSPPRPRQLAHLRTRLRQRNLPGYIDLTPKDGRTFPTGFLPTSYGGAPILQPSKRGGDLSGTISPQGSRDNASISTLSIASMRRAIHS